MRIAAHCTGCELEILRIWAALCSLARHVTSNSLAFGRNARGGGVTKAVSAGNVRPKVSPLSPELVRVNPRAYRCRWPVGSRYMAYGP